jgi:hypothetical protein
MLLFFVQSKSSLNVIGWDRKPRQQGQQQPNDHFPAKKLCLIIMIEGETRRFLLVNRLGKYIEKFDAESITDLNSLSKYCMSSSVQDLEVG